MNDKFDNQDLEKFFHDNLDQYGEEPGEGFWTELEPMIPPPPKKRKRRLFIWWFLGGLLMVAVGSYVWSNQRSLSDLEEKMWNQEQEIEALKKEHKTEEVATLKKEKEQGQIAEVKKSIDEKSTLGQSQKAIKSKQNQTTKTPEPTTNKSKQIQVSNKSFTVPFDLNNLETENNFTNQKNIITQKESSQTNIEETKFPLVERVLWESFDLLDLKRDSLDAPSNEETPALVAPIIKSPWEPRIGIGAFYESWILISSNSFEAPVDANREFSGNTIGLNFQLPLAEKWQLQTGLGLTKFTALSSTLKVLEIDLASAVERPGNVLFNNYFYNLESFLGRTQYETGISYRLNDVIAENPMQGDTFSIKVKEKVALDYLYIPLHLNYLLSKGKWGGKIGLGLDFYHLVNVGLESSATSSLRDGESLLVEDIIASEDIRLVGLRNVFLGGRIALGANYSFAKKWNLSVDAGYHIGIRNIAAHENSDRFPNGANVKINYLALRLGINYQF